MEWELTLCDHMYILITHPKLYFGNIHLLLFSLVEYHLLVCARFVACQASKDLGYHTAWK